MRHANERAAAFRDVQVKGVLGRNIGETSEAIFKRVARANGIVIDGNRLRCPDGTPSAGEFTDVFGSNCALPSTKEAADKAKSAAKKVGAALDFDRLPWRREDFPDKARSRYPEFGRLEPDERYSEFFRITTGTDDPSDGRIVRGYLKRSWHSNALVEPIPGAPTPLETAMKRWRSSFASSQTMRIEASKPDPQGDAATLVNAMKVGNHLGLPSYRVQRVARPLSPGDEVDIPLTAVAFNTRDVFGYEDGQFGDRAETWLEFPPDTTGLIFDDSETGLGERFGRGPLEAVARGRFMVERTEERELVDEDGRKHKRTVHVLRKVSDEPLSAIESDDEDEASRGVTGKR